MTVESRGPGARLRAAAREGILQNEPNFLQLNQGGDQLSLAALRFDLGAGPGQQGMCAIAGSRVISCAWAGRRAARRIPAGLRRAFESAARAPQAGAPDQAAFAAG